MESVQSPIERVQSKPWLLGVALATVFVALSKLWHFVSIFVFSPLDLSQTWSFMGDVLADSWGNYATYAVLAAIGSRLLWQERLRPSGADTWSIVRCAFVAFLPVVFVVDGLLSAVTAIMNDVPIFIFGVMMFG